jgi:hypothetical protein
MNFLVYQMLVEEEKFDVTGLINNISMIVCIRKVEAETKAEAIGKFIFESAKLKFVKRIEPVNCDELNKIITI